MADLATCYFCGGVDGVEEHPVIPEEMDPPDDEQRTVAVCPDCRLKFDRAVEPLVRFLGDSEAPTFTPSTDSLAESDPGDDEGGSDERVRFTESVRAGESRDGTSESAESEPKEMTDGVDIDDDSEDTGKVELPDASREILRLLQNREFPVDRDEIETVAETAYELGPHETSEAIDALVEYGVLEEENGRLDRSE